MAGETPPVLKALTVVLFAALAAAAFGVFVVLPERVRERPVAEVVEAPEPASAAPEVAELPSPRPEPSRPRPESPPAEPPPPAVKPSPPAPEPSPPAPEPSPPAPLPGGEGSRRAGSSDDDFVQAMSDGLAALDRRDLVAARAAFERAGTLRPGAPGAADGLQRVEVAERLAAVAEHRSRAATEESAERWHAALEHYEAALDVDATLAFAQEGRSRSGARAELAERLAFHIGNPERLSAAGVLDEASALLDQAAAVTPAGPRHQRQVAELRRLVEAYATPVRAVLRSDAATEVVVYGVGRLGTFTEQALELRPGTYTVVGSRRGYRDLRRQLVIEPGREPAPLVVACEEKI